MIYATTKTNSSLRNSLTETRGRGEHIRIWEERNRWSNSPYPLFRIYAELTEDSVAYRLMKRSSNYSQLEKGEFDSAIDRSTAYHLIKSLTSSKPRTVSPKVIILAGYPLSGKTTFANEFLHLCPEATIHVESDMVRDHIANLMGNSTPKFNYTESLRTFNTCWELIRLGLSMSVNVLFDATNLQEKGRFEAYESAEEYGAGVLIAMISSSPNEVKRGYNDADAASRRAYDHMHETSFTKVTRDYPFVMVESSTYTRGMIQELARAMPTRFDEMKTWIKSWGWSGGLYL